MAPRNFTPEFKSKVVEDAIRERNWCQVASKHGIHESTVRAWIKASGRHAEAMLNNPRSQRLASRRGAPRTTRVPTVASRPRNPFYPVVEHGVLQFIDRKRSEEGFRYTRKKYKTKPRGSQERMEFMNSRHLWAGSTISCPEMACQLGY